MKIQIYLAVLASVLLACNDEVKKMTKQEVLQLLVNSAGKEAHYTRLKFCPKGFSNKGVFSNDLEEACFATKGPVGLFAKDAKNWLKDNFTLDIDWRTHYGVSSADFSLKSNPKIGVTAVYRPFYEDKSAELKSFGLNPDGYVGYAKFSIIEE